MNAPKHHLFKDTIYSLSKEKYPNEKIENLKINYEKIIKYHEFINDYFNIVGNLITIEEPYYMFLLNNKDLIFGENPNNYSTNFIWGRITGGNAFPLLNNKNHPIRREFVSESFHESREYSLLREMLFKKKKLNKKFIYVLNKKELF